MCDSFNLGPSLTVRAVLIGWRVACARMFFVAQSFFNSLRLRPWACVLGRAAPIFDAAARTQAEAVREANRLREEIRKAGLLIPCLDFVARLWFSQRTFGPLKALIGARRVASRGIDCGFPSAPLFAPLSSGPSLQGSSF